MLGRLETMALSGGEYPADAIRNQIGEAIEIIVHLSRSHDGRRRVMRICELCGMKGGDYDLRDLFVMDIESGVLKRALPVNNTEKIALRGRMDGLRKLYPEQG